MGCSVSLMRVDLPEPDTPVTTMSFPSGNSTSISFKLLPFAPLIQMLLPLPSRRFAGNSMARLPFR